MADRMFPKAMFTRNPMVIASTGRPGYINTYEVGMNGNRLYGGRFQSPSDLDISEIADAVTPDVPDASQSSATSVAGLIVVEDSTALQRRTIEVTTGGDESHEKTVCIRGGVSPRNFRRLKELGKDIFTARLLDKRGNFFMTTRAHGWKIEIPENELFPLYFINTDDDDTLLRFRVPLTDMEIEWPVLARGIYALDINGIRERIYDLHDFWPSVFDVYYGDYLSCRIVVTASEPSKQQTILKFRNSMGVFETLELTGETETDTTAGQQDEEGRDRFDETTYTFVRQPGRKRMQTTLTAESGHKTSEQFAFMLDMLASDEVYLKDRIGWIRVDATAEETSRKARQTEPESIRIKLTFCDTSDNITPEITDLEDFIRPRIFSDQHTEEFN